MGQVVVPSAQTVSATTDAGGPTSVTFTAGTYESVAAALAQFIADLQAGRPPSGSAWTGSLSTGASGTGKVTIDAPTDTWSIAWTSTAIRDLFGFTANITSVTSAQTGGSAARGLWIPDSPIALDAYHLDAPRVSDLHQVRTPSGLVVGHVGNVMYSHRNALWSHVPVNKTWLAAESTTNESLERFLIDVQWGLGHSYFTPSSKCMIFAHDGNEVGNTTVAGWYLVGCESMEACVRRAADRFEGLYAVTIPELVTDS